MEPKDFDIMDKINSNLEKDYFDEKEFSSENKKKKVKFGSKIFKVLEEVPFSWFGIAFLILIILLFFFSSRNGVDDKQVAAIDTRLKKLEERIATVEIANIYITKIWEEAKTFEQFKERFNRSEASMTVRMNNIAEGQDKLQIKMAEAIPEKSGSQKPTEVSKKTAKKRYHTVRAGESLYVISRRYGLTVKKIQHLNKLNDRSVIYPGQKLLLTP
ncbi:MAG: LysM peptidoglycan-binding domain-containing protein [Pseudomonadota bacterium]